MSTATYATLVSKGDGAIVLMVPHSGAMAGVTLRQWAPPSLERWITPSSVPTHRRRAASGEGAIAKMTPKPQARAPARSGRSQSLAPGVAPLKSGLATVQWSPLSTERNNTWAPRYIACGGRGENTSGVIHVNR